MDKELILGIDLGTTNSLCAVWQHGQSVLIPNALGQVITPSVVSMDESGDVLVGQAAKDRLQTHPALTIARVKRLMGTDKTIQLGKRQFRAEEVSALVLKSLRDDARVFLGYSPQRAVITVPAYFSDGQRKATRAAGLLAGFAQVSLLNEPTAAGLAYGLHQKDSETQFLIFDFGGGTFDVSVLELFEGVMEVKASAGDNHLGGEDIDAAWMDVACRKSNLPASALRDERLRAFLLAKFESAKRQLTTGSAGTSEISVNWEETNYRIRPEKADFDTLIEPFLTKLRAPVERALRDVRIRAASLDQVVLVGGSTRLPQVRQMVARLFGRFPQTALNPDELVALGAAVQAGLLADDAALSERVMTDVCPYSLGVEVSQRMSNGRHQTGFMTAIIDRNTPIPTSREEVFQPLDERQTALELNVYQGEARMVRDNIFLGKLEVPIATNQAKNFTAAVRFTYDFDGVLEVEVTPWLAGQAQPVHKVLLKGHSSNLTEQEMQERIAALAALKIHPRDKQENRALLAWAERLFTQTQGPVRDHLGRMMAEFEMSIASQVSTEIEHSFKQLERLLQEIEADTVFF